MKPLKIHRRNFTVTAEQAVEIAFILFFSNSFFRTVLNWILHSNTMANIISLSLIYSLVLLACVAHPSKYIKADFIILYIFILIFFLSTITIHPDYTYYYIRSEYGVWDYVLIPYKGLYAYLFVRLINDPQKIKRNFKISGWIMYLYFVYSLQYAYRMGFWYGVSGSNDRVKMSYSVLFGYEVLFFELIFLYAALKNKKISDIVASVIGFILILAGGSRGPVLFMGVFIVLFLMRELKQSRKKAIFMTATVFATASLYALYTSLLSYLAVVLGKMGFSSRFIELLANGSVTQDSGRNRIWLAAINMIKEKPWGYGAMGSRKIISSYIVVGYPHSVILEILIDFGVVLGGILLIFYIINSIRIIFKSKYNEWCDIFLPLFCCSCALLISMTYWSFPSFWSCIAIGVNCFQWRKRRFVKKRVINT